MKALNVEEDAEDIERRKGEMKSSSRCVPIRFPISHSSRKKEEERRTRLNLMNLPAEQIKQKERESGAEQ